MPLERSNWRLSATLVLLASTLVAHSWIARRQHPAGLAAPLASVPAEIAGWTGADDPPLAPEVLRHLKADQCLSRTYRREGSAASLFIAYYSRQRANESMHAPKGCLPGNGWAIWDDSSATIDFAGRPVPISRYVIQKNGERLLALYWYQSRRHIAANEYIGKWYLIRDAILEGDTAGAIVRVIVPDRPDALRVVETFAATVIPSVQRCMGQGAAARD